jgi:predicted Zn-dependent peptidase
VRARTTRILSLLLALAAGACAIEAVGAEGFRLPPFEKKTLDNGLTVYLMERRGLPLVAVSMVFPAGAVRDDERSGLAHLTAETILLGTKKRTKEEIRQTLEALGASYDLGADKECAEITLSFLAGDAEKILPILVEIVTEPRFDEKDFETRKARLLSELTQEREVPSAVIGGYFDKLVFGDHVYASPVGGTRAAVKAIDLKQIKAFYLGHYVPSGSAIALAGDFDSAEMEKTISTLFGAWKGGGAPAPLGIVAPPAHEDARVVLVNKADATETRFMVGGPGIERNHADATAVAVVNTIFGGRFTSWLNDTLRVERGLTYGAYSYFDSHRYHGSFTMASFTETSNTAEAVDLCLGLLSKLHADGIDENTLRSAKNYMLGQFPPRYQRVSSFAGLLTEMHLYGLDRDYIDGFQKRVEAVTPAKAKEIVGRYFGKDALQFVLIGKAEAIEKTAAKYGKVVRKEIKDDGY